MIVDASAAVYGSRINRASRDVIKQWIFGQIWMIQSIGMSPGTQYEGRKQMKYVHSLQEARRRTLHRYVYVTMRDGVRIATDLYLPKNIEGSKPAVLMRTPYGKFDSRLVLFSEYLASHGYVGVVQDVRGRFDSEGSWHPYHNNEDLDAYDTLEWIVQQSWSNGLTAAVGSSYGGFTSFMAARTQHPSLRCLISRVPASGLYEDHYYFGGIFLLMARSMWGTLTNRRAGQTITMDDCSVRSVYENLIRGDPELLWSLPVWDIGQRLGMPLDIWTEWLSHPDEDEYWRSIEIKYHLDKIDLPVLHVEGWFDVFLDVGIRNYSGLNEQGQKNHQNNQRLLLGPWPHVVNSHLGLKEDFGAEGLIDLYGYERRWLDHWLKGKDTKLLEEPPIDIFVMGPNRWKRETAWPLERTQWTELYLQPNNGLGFSMPAADIPPSEYTYDPTDPTPAGMVPTWMDDALAWVLPVTAEERLAGRSDVLTFLSMPLESDLALIGPVTMNLWFETDVKDTDFFANLAAVTVDGSALLISQGQLRARYRSSYQEPELLSPGEVYELKIKMSSTSRVIPAGTRLRLDIQSAAMPLMARNLNTGADNYTTVQMVTARQKIFHDIIRPSHVVLPVIPKAGVG